jgi:hypothetical protein
MALNTDRSQVGVIGQKADIQDVNDEPGVGLIPSMSLGGATYGLLNNASATGSPTGPIVANSYIWAVAGTFGGATVKLQYLGPDGTTYIDVPSASLTAAGAIEVRIGAGAIVKAVVTGGAPSALYSNLT